MRFHRGYRGDLRGGWGLCLQLVIVAAIVSLSGAAVAQPKPKRLNLKPILDKLWVLQGDGGHHVIVVPPWERKAIRKMKLRFGGLMLFGKNGVYYRQYVSSASAFGTKRFSKRFVDNRVYRGGAVEYKEGVITLRCGKRKTKLKMIEGQRRQHILRKSKFYGRLWQRRALVLARDNLARYYYIDRLIKGQGFRLFYGPKGALKRIRLLDVAQDSEGSVFATRKGSLVLSRSSTSSRGYSRTRYSVKWVRKNGKENQLKYIPPYQNLLLIYRDLGVYAGKRFGTPCDVY